MPHDIPQTHSSFYPQRVWTESQTSLPRNVPSDEERGRDDCIRRLPFLAFLAVFCAPSLQYRCYFVAFDRRAKASAKRARNAEHARRRKVRSQLFLSAPSPVASVPRSSLAWHVSLRAWKTRKNNAFSASCVQTSVKAVKALFWLTRDLSCSDLFNVEVAKRSANGVVDMTQTAVFTRILAEMDDAEVTVIGHTDSKFATYYKWYNPKSTQL